MPRKKKHEDRELLNHLVDFWDNVCLHDRRRLTYPNFAEYLNEHGIDYDANALKHRPAVVEAMKTLKNGGSLAVETIPAPEMAEEEDLSPSYKELVHRYNDLQQLVNEAFFESVCAKILANHSIITYEEGLKPEVAESAILHPKDELMKNDNPFIAKLLKHAKIKDKKGE